MVILHIAVFVLVPALARWAAARSRLAGALGPVVVCYVAGILWGNQPWLPVPVDVAEAVAGGGVIASIALLLLALDVRAWRHLARRAAVAMVLAFVAVLVVSALAAWIFHDAVDRSWQVAGMLAGVYTGGTANMAAIATALDVAPERFLALSTADIVLGGAYYFFLLLWGARFFGWLLRSPAPRAEIAGEQAATDARTETRADTQAPGARSRIRVVDVLRALGLGAAIVGVSVAAATLAPPAVREAATILLVTTAAVLLSLHRRVRDLPGTYETGDYLLLVFCVAVGALARHEMLAAAEPVLLAYMATAMLGTLAVHVAGCVLFRVDRDTCIVTSTAALYGPAFVAPVALRLGNRALVPPGVTAGIIGLAAGNYLGLTLAWAVRAILG